MTAAWFDSSKYCYPTYLISSIKLVGHGGSTLILRDLIEGSGIPRMKPEHAHMEDFSFPASADILHRDRPIHIIRYFPGTQLVCTDTNRHVN